MKLVMEFDPQKKEEVDFASRVCGMLAQGTHVQVAFDPAGASETKVVVDDVKTAAGKKDKAADKKADEAAAAAAEQARKDEEAAAKKAEEEAAAAAKKAEEDALGGDDPLGDAGDDLPPLDRETVRQALTDYSKIEGRPAAIKLLTDNGAKSIAELAEDKFRAVYDAAQLGLKAKK